MLNKNKTTTPKEMKKHSNRSSLVELFPSFVAVISAV